MLPTDVRKVGDTEILVTWDDGHRSLYRGDYLRSECPCAGCVDEMTGRRILKKDQIAEATAARDIQPVGNYAYKFIWSDGHQTGIYSFDLLRRLCRCEVCSGKIKGSRG